jgi:hypothetical protein
MLNGVTYLGGGPIRRLLLFAVLIVACLAPTRAANAASIGSSWLSDPVQLSPTSGPTYELGPSRVACVRSQPVCFALDGAVHDGKLRLWRLQAANDPSSWSLLAVGPDRYPLQNSRIACPSPDTCLMIAAGVSTEARARLLTVSGLAGQPQETITTIGSRRGAPGVYHYSLVPEDVACASSSLCVVVGGVYGYRAHLVGQTAISTNPFAARPLWRLLTDGSSLSRKANLKTARAASFQRVDCPTVQVCFGLGDGGRVGVLRQPWSVRAKWHAFEVPPSRGRGYAQSISCVPSGPCVAFQSHTSGGTGSAAQDVLFASDPQAGRAYWTSSAFSASPGRTTSLSCSSARYCLGTLEYLGPNTNTADTDWQVRIIETTHPEAAWSAGIGVPHEAGWGFGWSSCWADHACVLLNTWVRQVVVVSSGSSL